MNSKKFVTLMMGCSVLVACQQEDFGVSEQEVYTSAYNREFTNTFGNVNPGQTWDLTTRAMTEYKSVAKEDGYYYVEDGTLNWFKENMGEYKDNSEKVHAFTLVTEQATTFEIVPLYQGGANYNWSVDMVVDGEVYAGWTWVKGDGSLQGQYKGSTTEWENLTTAQTQHGDATYFKALRSKPTKIVLSGGAHTIYFRINSESIGRVWVKDDTQFGGHYEDEIVGIHTSIEETPWIAALDVKTPENVLKVNPKYTSMIITCEGQSATNNNPDFNEAAFLLVGYVPEVITRDEVRTITKRYMMEDMGAIDWDFNDVVVDVTTTAEYNINTENGEATIKENTQTTTAKIAHLGGTYPVQVTVGATALPLISDPINKEQTEAELKKEFTGTPTYGKNGNRNDGWTPYVPEFAVRGFDPVANNVKLIVYKDFNPDTQVSPDPEKVWVAEFPERGAAPYIIAVDKNTAITIEGQSVEEMQWWKDAFGPKTEPEPEP